MESTARSSVSPRRLRPLVSRWTLAVWVAVGAGVVGASEPDARVPAPVTFVFTSDVHFGISRGKFRGAANVEARVVNAAMVDAINGLPAAVLPDDGGLRAGRAVGPLGFVTITGDLTNRQERLPLKIQSASVSWAQFAGVFLDGLRVADAGGRAVPLLLVPGNHDVSNAIGHPNGLLPETDATTMAELYNRMLHPATPRTKDTYRYATDKVYYARDFGGAHCIFLTMWPDSVARRWMNEDLKTVAATTPVFLFAHDPPSVDARHFTHPPGAPDSNKRDKFENVIADVYTGGATADGSTELEQRGFATWLKAHRTVVGYFHGHSNWNEFYTWTGPDQDVALAAFRADSPMKGRDSGKDETKLSFQVVVFDVAAQKLTARECRWNPTAGAGGNPGAIAWGASTTVSLAPR